MKYIDERTESYWTSCFQKRFNHLADSDIGSLTAEPGYILGVLDHEIEFLTGLVQSFKARRNAVSSISRLPPEVLVLIFKAYKDDDVNALKKRDRRALAEFSEYCSSCMNYYSLTYIAELPENLGWMECSRVCRRWRNLIFGTSSLWSDIVVEWGPSWLQRFLKYSQSAPTIRFLGYLSEPSLVFLIHDEEHLSLPSTILKTIELTVTTSIGECFTSGDNAVPLGLLLHNFPALERISLCNCLVNWEPPSVPSRSLRFMEVITGERVMRSRDSVKFYDAKSASEFLRSTPVLEILTLVYCFPFQCHEDTGMEKGIELPCLRELVLEEVAELWCSYFFGRLQKFPATLPIRLRFRSDLGGGNGKNLIKSHLQQRFHGVESASGYLELLSAKDSQCPDFEGMSYWKVHTHVISSEVSSLEAPIQSGLETGRDIDLCCTPRYLQGVNDMTISYEACSLLPMFFVRTLVIERASERLWELFDERFPSITSITCLDKSSIFHSSTDFTVFDKLITAFPKLAFLKLRWVRLEATRYEAEAVLAWLRRRKARRGGPIERLVLECCHPCSTWRDAAWDLVEHIEIIEGDCSGDRCSLCFHEL